MLPISATRPAVHTGPRPGTESIVRACAGSAPQLPSNGLVKDDQLGLENANGRARHAQHQSERWLKSTVQLVGLTRRTPQVGGDHLRIGEATTSVLLDEGRQVLQRGLGDLLRGKLLEQRLTGRPERIAERLLLAESTELHEQEIQEVALLARQRLAQMRPITGQPL